MNTLVDDYRAAREAGKIGWTNIDPEPAMIHHFFVMHMSITDEPEREFAEAIDRSDDFIKNSLAMEYVSAYLDTHNIPWGSFTVGRIHKYEHGRSEDSYHYCFEAIVKPRVTE